jgi:hypothetical protein
MSLLCLELYAHGEVSLGASWVTLVVGVGCQDRAALGVGVHIEFRMVFFGVVGTVFVVFVVRLPLVLRWGCSWLALEAA